MTRRSTDRLTSRLSCRLSGWLTGRAVDWLTRRLRGGTIDRLPAQPKGVVKVEKKERLASRRGNFSETSHDSCE